MTLVSRCAERPQAATLRLPGLIRAQGHSRVRVAMRLRNGRDVGEPEPAAQPAPFPLLALPSEVLDLIAVEAVTNVTQPGARLARAAAATALGFVCRALRPAAMRAFWHSIDIDNIPGSFESAARRAETIETCRRWAGSTRRVGIMLFDSVHLDEHAVTAEQLVQVLRHMPRVSSIDLMLTVKTRDAIGLPELQAALAQLPIATVNLESPVRTPSTASRWSPADWRNLFGAFSHVRRVGLVSRPGAMACFAAEGLALGPLPQLVHISTCVLSSNVRDDTGGSVAALAGALARAAGGSLRELVLADSNPWPIVRACADSLSPGAFVMLGQKSVDPVGVDDDSDDAASGAALVGHALRCSGLMCNSFHVGGIPGSWTSECVTVWFRALGHLEATEALVRRVTTRLMVIVFALRSEEAPADIAATVDRLVDVAIEAKASVVVARAQSGRYEMPGASAILRSLLRLQRSSTVS